MSGVVSSLVPFPFYEGSVAVSGSLAFEELYTAGQNHLFFAGELSGLPSSSSGGVHIHSVQNEGGSDCLEAIVGGHYYDSSGDDPWGSVTWR